MLTYTFGQLKNAAEHALGGVPDSRISSGLIVNRAINHLVNAHAWDWRQTIASLDYTATQGYIDLPTDFGELIQLQASGGRLSTVRSVSPATFMSLLNRASSSESELALSYFLAIAPQTTPTAVPRWRLNIHPTPAASVTGALALLYRKMVPVFAITGTADDAKVPAIPAGQHDTLYALVRAFAVSMEEDPSTQEWSIANAALQRDINADSRADDASIGYMRNTGVDNWFNGGSLAGTPRHDRIDSSDLP